MNAHKTTKPDDPAQSRAFIEKAREVEADEEKSAADALMGKLAHMPPDPKPKAEKKRSSKRNANPE